MKAFLTTHSQTYKPLNESAIQMNQLNEWFNDKLSDLPPAAGSFSFIFKVSFQLFKSFQSIFLFFKMLYLKYQVHKIVVNLKQLCHL